MLFDFVTPVSKEKYDHYLAKNPHLSGNVAFWKMDTSETENFKIAVVGVEDYLGNEANKGTQFAPDSVREQLYAYAPFYHDAKILDLGNIKAGNTHRDTLAALKETAKDAIKNNIILVIIGGDLELLQAQYTAYEILENEVQLSHIGAALAVNHAENNLENSYLYNIFNTNYLKKYNLIAYQSYFIKKDIATIVHNYQFDSLRVGKIRENIFEAEPFIREADLVCFDIQAIRHSDAPAQLSPSPNGLFGDEACMLARFAGSSDIVSTFGIYNFNTEEDIKNITAHQVSQMIWYFVEGVMLRKQDYPIVDEQDFYSFAVIIDEEDFIFLKSKKTDRWWMKIKVIRMGKSVFHLVPCTYRDYQTALNGEIPESWMRNLMRLQ
jgi:arginase family enzyme